MREVRRAVLVTGIIVALVACSKKQAETADGGAPAVVEALPPGDPPAEPDASALNAPAPGGSVERLLPAGASVYGRVDLAAMLAAEPTGQDDEIFSMLPPECRRLARELREVTFAGYFGEPSGVVAVVLGPTDQTVRECAADDGETPRTQASDAREILHVGENLAAFRIDETTFVAARLPMLDAAIAAADGGPNLVGDPVVGATSLVPGGWLAVGMIPWDDVRSRAGSALMKLGIGPAIAVPEALALSSDWSGGKLGIHAALRMPDDIAAEAGRLFLEPAVASAGARWRELQDGSTGRPMAASDRAILTEIGALLDSLAVGTGDTVLRVDGEGQVTPLTLAGVGLSVAVPLYLRLVQSSQAEEPRLNLAKIAALTEVAAMASIAAESEGGGYPTNDRVSVRCPAPDCNAECVPRSFASVAGGREYVPDASEWLCSTPGPGCAGDTAWNAINFAITGPIRFQYCWSAAGTGNDSTFTVSVFGDMDGDGIVAAWARQGVILNLEPMIGPIAVTNEGE